MNNSEGGQKAQPSQMRMAMDFFYDSDEAEYCRDFAFRHFPEYDVDDDGNLSFSGSGAGVDIMWCLMFGDPQFLFTKEDYLGNNEIQGTIEAIGLDSEKFWWAILFIHHLADTKYRFGFKPSDSYRIQLKELIEILSDEGAILSLKGSEGKKITIDDPTVLGILKGQLLQFVEENSDNCELDTRKIGICDSNRVEESTSMQIFYEMKCFQEIFKAECKDVHLPRHHKSNGVSRDKLLLISRIIYMLKLTYNEAFLESSDSLKGIRKSYKNRNIERSSGYYLV